MEYIIWYDTEKKTYQLDQQITGSVLGGSDTQYLRILYRFNQDQLEDAERILAKLNAQSEVFR